MSQCSSSYLFVVILLLTYQIFKAYYVLGTGNKTDKVPSHLLGAYNLVGEIVFNN